MNLEVMCFENLSSIPVHLVGTWQPGPHRAWQGVATASVPLVGISFLEIGDYGAWCKSERREASPEVQLLLLHYDDEGRDVQVNFSLGQGGRRFRTELASASYRPELPDNQILHTAQIYRFGTVEGDPLVNLYLMFIHRNDVKALPKGLWRVRKHLESSLREPFRFWLTYGRTGKWGG